VNVNNGFLLIIINTTPVWHRGYVAKMFAVRAPRSSRACRVPRLRTKRTLHRNINTTREYTQRPRLRHQLSTYVRIIRVVISSVAQSKQIRTRTMCVLKTLERTRASGKNISTAKNGSSNLPTAKYGPFTVLRNLRSVTLMNTFGWLLIICQCVFKLLCNRIENDSIDYVGYCFVYAFENQFYFAFFFVYIFRS